MCKPLNWRDISKALGNFLAEYSWATSPLARVGDGEPPEVERAAHLAILQYEDLGVYRGFQEGAAE
jgi:hypothetical protein